MNSRLKYISGKMKLDAQYPAPLQTEEMCILIAYFLVSLCERPKSWQFWSWKFF